MRELIGLHDNGNHPLWVLLPSGLRPLEVVMNDY